MRIGGVETERGKKTFLFFETVTTRGAFPLRVPLHVINGAADGPTLLVQAGVNGLEIEPAMVLPALLRELDPRSLAGTLLVVPLLNMSGFEFGQDNAIWDDKNLHFLNRGREEGTVSEQMIFAYYKEVVSRADALIDIRTGGPWGYFRYAGIYKIGAVNQSLELAASLGLPQVLVGQPVEPSIAYEAAQDEKPVVSAWIGGGPGLRDFRDDDTRRIRTAVLNGLRQLRMLSGELERPDGLPAIVEAHTVLRNTRERGLTIIDRKKRGTRVRAGESLGYVMHPFTGDIVQEIQAPRDGLMLDAGAAWPIIPEGYPLAILGDPFR